MTAGEMKIRELENLTQQLQSALVERTIESAIQKELIAILAAHVRIDPTDFRRLASERIAALSREAGWASDQAAISLGNVIDAVIGRSDGRGRTLA